MTSNVPSGYDPVTLFHWLWWKLCCLEASPQEFQRLFEKVAARLGRGFMRVRPYGRLGDRKCDGLYWGGGTVFQVYSPDELKQDKTVAKIKKDLSGAFTEWGHNLKKWVFVYNTRIGVGPDVPRILHAQKRKYPQITIEPLSSDELWERMRKLSLQQRAEILGAPPGYEHLFLIPGVAAKEIKARLRDGRFIFAQDVLSPINLREVVKALKPEKPFGPPIHIGAFSSEDSWQVAAEHQRKIVEEALEKSRHLLPRFAVFSLAPIPLAIHLGYLLSDRVEARIFRYDRDRKTWGWDQSPASLENEFRIQGLPTTPVDDLIDVIVRVSLSARIPASETTTAVGGSQIQIDLSVSNPNVMWLRHEKQLAELGRAFRSILEGVNRFVPHCKQIHIFYAGPTGGAIVIGQAINPRMYPSFQIYDYDRQKIPRYQQVLALP